MATPCCLNIADLSTFGSGTLTGNALLAKVLAHFGVWSATRKPLVLRHKGVKRFYLHTKKWKAMIQ
jgi:hypothetical protein